jgi:hypothetical protein
MPIYFIIFMCIGQSAALSILSKISSNKLFDECQKLSESKHFEKMIEKLSKNDKIPILAEDAPATLWNDANYPKHLSTMQSFMAEVKLHDKEYKNPPMGPKHWSDPKGPTKRRTAYLLAVNFRTKMHRVCCE